jgi:pyruvate dehydrogenase E1 component beta subunit
MPYGGGVRAPELHDDSPEAYYVHTPGVKVAIPSTPADAKGLLAAAIDDPDPVLFCEPLRGYRLVKGEVPDGEHRVPFGQARLAREGSDLVVIAWSAAVAVAEAAAQRAEEEDGIEAAVLDLRTLVPLDVDGIREAVGARGRALVVHEAPYTSGFGAEVVATAQEEAFWALEAPIERVAGHDVPYPIAAIEEHYVPSVERVLAGIRGVAEARA